MIESILVYGILTFSLIVLGIISSKRAALYPSGNNSIWQWQIVSAILLFTMVFGMRYGVGSDYFTYLQYFQHETGIFRTEIGFKMIRNILSDINAHYTVYFSVLALLQFLFFMYAFKNEQYLYPFLILVLFTGGYFITWMNVIRQSIAACIFLYAIKFIEQRKIIPYFLWIAVATLFHFSAAFLLVVYPFLAKGRNYFKSVFIQFVIFFTAISLYYVGFDPKKLIGSILEFVAPVMGYKGYILTGSIFNRQTEGNTGLGYLLIVIIDLFIISFSGKMNSFYNSKRFNILYNLYFIGTIARVMFAGTFILLRPFLYFIYFKIAIAAYLFYYFYKNLNYRLNLLFLLLLFYLYLMNFVPYIYFGEQYNSEFLFFWQQNN